MTELEREFEEDMKRLYRVAAAKGYHARYFLEMVVTKGSVQTACDLLRVESVQSGLFRLAELDLLAASMENIVLNPKYSDLFGSSVKRVARERLEALGFTPGGWE